MILNGYNGSACEVSDLNNKLIAKGYIILLDDALEIHDVSKHLPFLNLDTRVKISIHNPKYGIRVLAGRVYISNRKFIRVTDLENYAEYEKRRFFRLAVDLSATLLLPVDQQGERQKLAARIKDISLCGIQMEVDGCFAVGDHLSICIPMYSGEEERLEIIVRRIIKKEEKQCRYGCELIDLSAYAERQLCALIIRQQQEQIRRLRGK